MMRTVYPHTVLQGRIILTTYGWLQCRFLIGSLTMANLSDNCTLVNKTDLHTNSEYAGTSQSLFNFSQECYCSGLHEADQLPVTRTDPGLWRTETKNGLCLEYHVTCRQYESHLLVSLTALIWSLKIHWFYTKVIDKRTGSSLIAPVRPCYIRTYKQFL
jgi:hypothetical protein